MTLSKSDDTIDVKWSESETFPKGCLRYDVKYYKDDLDSGEPIPVSFHNCFFFYESFVIFVVENEQLHVNGSSARDGSAV